MKEENVNSLPLLIITQLISLLKSIIVSLTFVARLDYRANCHLSNFDNSHNFHKFALEIVADTIPILNVFNYGLSNLKSLFPAFSFFFSLKKKAHLSFYAICNFLKLTTAKRNYSIASRQSRDFDLTFVCFFLFRKIGSRGERCTSFHKN